MLRVVVVLVTLFLSSISLAETRFGAAAVMGNYTVEDPDGNAGDSSESSVVGIMTMPINRNFPGWRYWFQLGHNSFELDAATDEIGQDVTSTSVEGIIQKGFNVSSDFKPWLGAGVGAAMSDFNDRFTVDSDGFLAERFEDRSSNSAYLILNTGISSRELSKGFYVGVSLSYKKPLNDGIEATELNLFFLY